MNEKQNPRYDLLKANNYDVKNAKACYDFVEGENKETAATTTANGLADGIYLMTEDGAELYTGQAINENAIYTGVGVKLGNKSLVVAMGDMTEDEITLTEKKGGTLFITSYHEAVADWNGKENTDDIRDILNGDILLADNEYIPSLGEMYFILLHIYEINKALKAIGGKPLSGWYWSSTQYSATYAWLLSLYNGRAGYNTKATGQGRVRAVSAFLPLNS
jgi:hypothetical protein